MARQPFQSDFTSFIKGLITEANALTFPDNASLEEVNFLLNPDGSRQRRLGMDFEDGYVKIDTGYDVTENNLAITTHTWTAVASRGDLEFVVVQVGTKLFFFDANAASISGSTVNGGNTVTLTGSASTPVSTASLYGKLIIADGSQTVTILSYDISSDTITATTSRLKTRDLFGVDDEMDVDERPATTTDEHTYNLRNQGWPLTIDISNTGMTSATNGDPIETTKTRIGVYPSNADVVWAAKISSAKEVAALNSYRPEELRRVVFGSTQAPLGSHVIDVFNRGASRQTISGSTTLADDQTSGGVTAVAAYAGRVFYALKETGLTDGDSRSPNLGTMIFFSVAKDSKETFTKCYSEADPTAEHVFDPIATDGGFITIPEAGEVKRLVPMGSSLFVFCSNGVWEIHGGEEPFSALNHSVSKTTDIGVASPDAIVYAEDKIAFWGLSGIYLITRNDLTLRGSNTDLTYNTIQTLFDSIDLDNKQEAVGAYDPYTRSFKWLYRDTLLPNSSFFNKELIYDVNLGAFYLYNIDVPDFDHPFVTGFINLADTIFVSEKVNVIADEDEVIAVEDDVISTVRKASPTARSGLKYVTIVKDGDNHAITMAYYRNLDFRDWYSYDGVGIDAPAHMLTGYITGGQLTSEKMIDYLWAYFVRTESGFDEDGNTVDHSSCTVQFQWDWTNNANFGRWGRAFEAYRLPRPYLALGAGDSMDYSYTTIVSKSRVRGRGRALSILFKSKPYHNLHLLGWSLAGSAISN